MVTDKDRLDALKRYLSMKHKAGVKKDKEFIIIKNGQIIATNYEEYKKMKNA
jgi:hypothetical protein